jgi:hypothetical protein
MAFTFLPTEISVGYDIHDNNHYVFLGSHETHGQTVLVTLHVTAYGKFVTRLTVHRTVRLWIGISLYRAQLRANQGCRRGAGEQDITEISSQYHATDTVPDKSAKLAEQPASNIISITQF